MARPCRSPTVRSHRLRPPPPSSATPRPDGPADMPKRRRKSQAAAIARRRVVAALRDQAYGFPPVPWSRTSEPPHWFQQVSVPIHAKVRLVGFRDRDTRRSEEHTSELQSLMRISYAVFCLNKKT